MSWSVFHEWYIVEKVKIGDDETTGELWDRLSKIGARLLVKTLKKIEKEANNKEIKELESKLNDETNKDFIDEKAERKVEKNSEKKVEENIKEKLKELVGARKQGNNFTVAPMLTKEMAEIDWNKTGREIHNLVRGLSPKIGAYTFYNGKKIKIWKTQIIKEDELEEIINSSNSENGEIIFADKKNGIVVKTPDGAIRILEIQAENSKRMTSKDFLNGNRIEINTVLTKSL